MLGILLSGMNTIKINSTFQETYCLAEENNNGIKERQVLCQGYANNTLNESQNYLIYLVLNAVYFFHSFFFLQLFPGNSAPKFRNTQNSSPLLNSFPLSYINTENYLLSLLNMVGHMFTAIFLYLWKYRITLQFPNMYSLDYNTTIKNK